MNETESRSQPLEGKQVAFTGRLAALSRSEAIDLVRSLGGTYHATVSRGASILVIGQQGWPLKKDGRLTRQLSQARLLQSRGHRIDILREQEFYESIGTEELGQGLHRRYSMAQLTTMLGVTRDRLRRWIQCGLVDSPETIYGIAYFNFEQASQIKSLLNLLDSGVTLKRIERSFLQLKSWLPGADDFLARLSRFEGGERLILRGVNGELLEPSGQLLFDFSEDCGEKCIRMVPATDDLFSQAVSLEELGRFDDAAAAYRQLLELEGPDSDVCFNLANTLYALGDHEAAIERYRRAVEIDSEHVDALNNLGNVLCQLGRYSDAIEAFERVLIIDPTYADAHFGLAETLELKGLHDDARIHWQAYLNHDEDSEWAQYARKRLPDVRATRA